MMKYINTDPNASKKVTFLGDTDVKVIVTLDCDEGGIIATVKLKSENWELDQGIYVLPRRGS